jgi:hypothetical protein
MNRAIIDLKTRFDWGSWIGFEFGSVCFLVDLPDNRLCSIACR